MVLLGQATTPIISASILNRWLVSYYSDQVIKVCKHLVGGSMLDQSGLRCCFRNR